jgi:hypothetical protein
MKFFNWNQNKNEALKRERNISFEIIIFQIEGGYLLDIIQNRNQVKYKNQKMFIVEFENYAFLVPFVETENEIFLKTIIPSRKATRKYLKEDKNE